LIIHTQLKFRHTTEQKILSKLSEDELTTYIMLQKSKIPVSLEVSLDNDIPSSDSVKKSLIRFSKLGLIHLD